MEAMSKKIDKSDIDHFQDNNIYVPTRTIYMGPTEADGETDCIMAEKVIKNLHILDHRYEPEKPISIIMSNPGGHVEDGMAIYDAIKACQSQVNIIVYGKAWSMASVILQAADVRIMAPNSKLMIHYGTIGVEGHPKMVKSWIKDGDDFDQWMQEMFLEKIRSKHPKFKDSKLEEMMNFDKIFTADEAVEIGLADYVLGQEPT